MNVRAVGAEDRLTTQEPARDGKGRVEHRKSERHDRNEEREVFAVCTDLMSALHAVPQPVIAAVQGVAVAAGCQLVAACDLAVAADTAVFGTPGVKIGLFCSTPMVAVTRAIGRRRALQLLLTGETID